MGNNRGFTLLELIVTAGVIGVAAAVAIPAMNNAVQRNKVITSAELVAAQIREARLAAVSRSQPFIVRWACPAAGAFRMLELTGDASIDDDPDRCTTSRPNDGPPLYLPQSVALTGNPPVVLANSRGQISAIGGTMPLTLSVTYGTYTRSLVVSATGRVAIADE